MNLKHFTLASQNSQSRLTMGLSDYKAEIENPID